MLHENMLQAPETRKQQTTKNSLRAGDVGSFFYTAWQSSSQYIPSAVDVPCERRNVGAYFGVLATSKENVDVVYDESTGKRNEGSNETENVVERYRQRLSTGTNDKVGRLSVAC